VSRVVTTEVVPWDNIQRFLEPRDGVVAERATGDGRFEASEGPVRRYERTVRVEDLGDGTARVTQTIEYRLAVPYVAWLFALPFRRAMARGERPDGRAPWWAPPQRVDAKGATALGSLAVAAAIGGYLTGLLTTSIAFAGREFGEGSGSQAVAGVVIRFGGAVALVAAVAAADRLGRRRVILGAAAAGCVLTAAGALAPSLPWLTASQAAARPLGVALLICASIAAAEEMPAGSRAYAVSALGLAAAFGAGVSVAALPVADLGERAWRILYVLPLAGLPLVWRLRRNLPETRRFAAVPARARLPGHGGRLWLLASSAFLFNLLAAPTAFFQNRYLAVERGFSALGISVFTVATGTPGALGVIVGGRLADTRGRRPVGAVAVAGYAITHALVFLTAGPTMWTMNTVGAIVGSASLPALGVYGAELFPTSLRGRAGGLLALAGLMGSAAGLLVAGTVADAAGSFGPAIAPLAIGPLLLAVLVLAAYPETARRSLEDLNPEDRPPPAAGTG
jgi:MFS family permease